MIASNYLLLLALCCFTCCLHFAAVAVESHPSHHSEDFRAAEVRPSWQLDSEEEELFGRGRVAPTSGRLDRSWHHNNNNRLQQHHTDWCSKDCAKSSSGGSLRPICASDGRAYKSMCELKRHSCRHNVRLRRRPRTFCNAITSSDSRQDVVDEATTTTTTMASQPKDERVRIVELRKLCDLQEYTQMKRSLFDEFNGNVWSMFRYFDTNGDARIEAHELWPAPPQEETGAKLIYAQVWDNHAAHCPTQSDNNDNRAADQSRCWYFLDFAFQPHNASKNACSLSHLMLFDLKHPNHQFDYETFAEAFANFARQQNSSSTTITKSSKVVLNLGDHIDLVCGADGEANKHVINKDNEVSNDDDDEDEKVPPRCTWTRYNSNLAASRDLHVSISSSPQKQWPLGNGPHRSGATEHANAEQQLKLHIRDAQLYLSGYYKCICHIKQQQQQPPIDLEHTYHLQVLAEPRVRVLPHYQWSLPKSRISFECQYDHISTEQQQQQSPSDTAKVQDNKLGNVAVPTDASAALGSDAGLSQFGLPVEWTTRGESLSRSSSDAVGNATRRSRSSGDLLVDQLLEFSSATGDDPADNEEEDDDSQERCNSSSRISVTKAISKLSIEDLQPCDSGAYTCRVELPQRSSLDPNKVISGQNSGRLVVQDRPAEDRGQQQQSVAEERGDVSALWILHENGISIYRIQDDASTTITKSSKVVLNLGDHIDLVCGADGEANKHVINKDNEVSNDDDDEDEKVPPRCTWTRYNSNLAASRDLHVSISSSPQKQWPLGNGPHRSGATEHANAEQQLKLHIRDAQLYLSGYYKCICHIKQQQQQPPIDLEHTYHLQVLAEPRVRVLPHYQWSLPKSRISFECQYDHISTEQQQQQSPSDTAKVQDNKLGNVAVPTDASAALGSDAGLSQFGLPVEWTTRGESLSRSSSDAVGNATRRSRSSGDLLVDQLLEFSSATGDDPADNEEEDDDSQERCNSSSRISVTKAISKLSIEDLQPCDSGAYTCRVELPQRSSLDPNKVIFGQDSGRLVVQDRPAEDRGQQQQSVAEERGDVSALWILHENGISIYRIQDDDGQEMELMREVSGHSPISARIEGNWNQLTLCGGINSEQAVTCEWSDNAVLISAHKQRSNNSNSNKRGKRRPTRKYVYVGQPNLNRVLAFDSFKFEIVAIINTEPQPRRLHLYEPNKIHLSKWVKRRLSPIANARWRQQQQQQQQHLQAKESTPRDQVDTSEPRLNSPLESKLLSIARPVGGPDDSSRAPTRGTNSNVNETTTTIHEDDDDDGAEHSGQGWRAKRAAAIDDGQVSLVQHDIWLLCYGQPLAGLEEGQSVAATGRRHHHHSNRRSSQPAPARPADGKQSADSSLSSSGGESFIRFSHQNSTDSSSSTIKPFEPRLRGGSGGVFPSPFAWPSNIWSPSSQSASSGRNADGSPNENNKESRLRNRKSVHIIQTTFLPSATSRHYANDGSLHSHHQPNNYTLADEFERSSVISTHHIYPAAGASLSPERRQRQILADRGRRLQRRRAHSLDLIQDLHIPQKPYSMEANPSYKIHYAYVSHYDERRLFRVSMDNYRYDREIDLQDCDPIHVLTTAQGLIVVQCRAPISHSLIGQLVLDQLSSARIEFNANIRAQESYLSPDNRYLVSIFHNAQASTSSEPATTNSKRAGGSESFNSSATSQDDNNNNKRHSSIVYVQTVGIDGLRLQYEIKTLFEISQCSFVWKDGYYAAIFVTSNRKEQQSEILSLRLIDSRLELTARVPGLVSETRHKEQLIVSPPELRLAALTTNQGTFVIDLEENRVSQSLRRHLAPPTLLWV